MILHWDHWSIHRERSIGSSGIKLTFGPGRLRNAMPLRLGGRAVDTFGVLC